MTEQSNCQAYPQSIDFEPMETMMVSYLPTAIYWLVAFAYLNGAAVHAANMLGYGGYDWLEAPFKWQVLDVFYLVLDIAVALGLVLGWRAGLFAFFTAAASQIVLYTALRSWVLNVPDHFLVAGAEASLNGLLAFHATTATLVLIAGWLKAAQPA